jgi:hypothetical protein
MKKESGKVSCFENGKNGHDRFCNHLNELVTTAQVSNCVDKLTASGSRLPLARPSPDLSCLGTKVDERRRTTDSFGASLK